ncbi:MAG: glyoxalase [Acidimicrobiia bacterium]|nr:glyoxalase [Acidimicrobiia bacterium]
MQLHHAQVAIPPGGEDQARSFWIDIVGFTEIPKPEPMASRGGLWIRDGTCEIHLGIEEPFAPARKADPGLVVEDIDRLEERLGWAGYQTTEDTPIYGLRRFHVSDPFGNRIEFLGRSPDTGTPTG